MRDTFIFFIVIAVIVMIALTELAAATLPILIVVTLVPPEHRAGLAEVLAAADSSRRLRLWPALRAAVTARRAERSVASVGGSGDNGAVVAATPAGGYPDRELPVPAPDSGRA
jgi:hypothetical protein